MSKVKSVLAAALTLAVVGVTAKASVVTTTSGIITMTVTSEGIPTNPFGESAPGYTAYLVHLSTTDGSLITNLNFSGTGAALETGFTGSMLQEEDYTASRGVNYTAYPNIAESAGTGLNGQNYGIDSHFLLNGIGSDVVISAPAEVSNAAHTGTGNANTTTVTAGSDDTFDVWGTGTSLTTNVGLVGANSSASLDVAYLVIPTGGSVSYDFNVATTNAAFNGGFGSQFDGTIPAGTVITPEPASLGLLGMGAVALLARRKSVRGTR